MILLPSAPQGRVVNKSTNSAARRAIPTARGRASTRPCQGDDSERLGK